MVSINLTREELGWIMFYYQEELNGNKGLYSLTEENQPKEVWCYSLGRDLSIQWEEKYPINKDNFNHISDYYRTRIEQLDIRIRKLDEFR